MTIDLFGSGDEEERAPRRGRSHDDDGDDDEHAPARSAPLPRPASAASSRPPLAERMRPRALDEVVGQRRLTAPDGPLRRSLARGVVPSLVLWGPPGCGKTTIARLIAAEAGKPDPRVRASRPFVGPRPAGSMAAPGGMDAEDPPRAPKPFAPFSAVTGGVKEVRAIVAEARHRIRIDGQSTVLFVDEIHRFNRAQQDAFLPHVEQGTIVLLGATTENPSLALNAALLSRAQVEVLAPLGQDLLVTLLRRALADAERGLARKDGPARATDDALEKIAAIGQGDARTAYGVLEAALLLATSPPSAPDAEVAVSHVDEAVRGTTLRHDRAGDAHYDLASALIKSLRGSDPDAGLYWLARLLEGGEDPRFVARRLMIFAAEDVSNADPRALGLATAAAQAVALIGMPEARIVLAQAVTFLALCPKSNASYLGIGKAIAAVQEHGPLPVPLHLRNAPTGLLASLGHGRGYEYAHDLPGGVGSQVHLPAGLEGARLYEPTDRGQENELRARLERLRALRAHRPRES